MVKNLHLREVDLQHVRIMSDHDDVVSHSAEFPRGRIHHVIAFRVLARDGPRTEDWGKFLRELLLVVPPYLPVNGKRPLVAVSGALVGREDGVLAVGRIHSPQHLLLLLGKLAQLAMPQRLQLREVRYCYRGYHEVAVERLPHLVPGIVRTDIVRLAVIVHRGVLGVIVLDEPLAP